MNMWWVDPRGRVEGAWCKVDKIPWSRYTIAGKGSANTNGSIFSLHRFWLTEEIWWITKDGGIMVGYWYEGMGRWGTYQLHPPGTAKPYGTIFGNSRDLGIMDIFYERMDGTIHSSWYEFHRKDFGANIPSAGLAALGGWTNVSLFDDGFMLWNGQGYDSGADDYDYSVVGFCKPRSGASSNLAPIINVHKGHVEGHFIGSSGRSDPWREPVVAVDILRTNWEDYAQGHTFDKLLNATIKWTVGSMLEGAGVFILVGATAYSLVTTGDATAGARIVNGILYMAGPMNTLLAVAAEGIASIGSRSRQISAEEYKWANDQVFRGTLPPANKILITDTKGKDERAFVWPLSDGRMSVNLGGKPGMYENPRDLKFAHTFIHELVHTWQIHHTSFELGLLVNAFANQLKGDSAYKYGPAGPSFKGGFNVEQQASIVEHWWERSNAAGAEQVNDPYYRYIRDNIRAGQYF